MRVSYPERALTYAFLALFSFFATVPIMLVLFAAMQDPRAQLTGIPLPTGIHIGTFESAWTTGHFSEYMRSSFIVTMSVVCITTVLSTLAGYAFGTIRLPLSNMLFYAFILGLVIPEEALIFPLYFDFEKLSLLNTYWALILPQSGLSLSFGVFWMRAFFRSTPRHLFEAARMEGASSLRILTHILVPLARPALSTLVVLSFMWNWNEFLLPLIMVTSNSLRTLPLGLAYFQVGHLTNQVGLAAASVLVALPVVILYVFLQRRFIGGMLSGAIKR